jgi:hypothetical protein
MNEELLVSLLEPTSWCEHSSPERADCQTEPLIGYVKKFILMVLRWEALSKIGYICRIAGMINGDIYSDVIH